MKSELDKEIEKLFSASEKIPKIYSSPIFACARGLD